MNGNFLVKRYELMKRGIIYHDIFTEELHVSGQSSFASVANFYNNFLFQLRAWCQSGRSAAFYPVMWKLNRAMSSLFSRLKTRSTRLENRSSILETRSARLETPSFRVSRIEFRVTVNLHFTGTDSNRVCFIMWCHKFLWKHGQGGRSFMYIWKYNVHNIFRVKAYFLSATGNKVDYYIH